MSRKAHPILYSLQIGRALAAMAVAIDHAALASRFYFKGMPDFYFTLLNLGYLGVDYFFVLSGFIIAHATHSLSQNNIGAKKYALARCIRVYVPYLPLSILAILAFTLFPTISGGRNSFSLLASLFLVPSNLLPALPDAKTLQHEMIFYLLFGLCFFCLKKPALIFLWAAPIIALSFFNIPAWASVICGTINLEFLLGIAAFYFYHRRYFFSFHRLLMGFGLFLLILYCALILTRHC